MQKLVMTLSDEALLREMAIVKEAINEAKRIKKGGAQFTISNAYVNLNTMKTEYVKRKTKNQTS